MSAKVLSRSDKRRIVTAIGDAELGHRGEIQVYLEARYAGDGPIARAEALFAELGLDKTRDGTGVLLYIATDDQRSAVWAGPGVYGARDQRFWRGVCDAVASGFRDGDPTGGIIFALKRLKDLLSVAASGRDLKNERPNRVFER